jgi:hypothetical protein
MNDLHKCHENNNQNLHYLTEFDFADNAGFHLHSLGAKGTAENDTMVSTYIGCEWSASRLDRVIQGETEPRDPWDTGCVGPRVDLDALDTTDNSVANGGDRTQTIRMSKP